MDRLSPLDALFVDAEDEDPRTSMAIASIAVFEGPAPTHEEFLAFLAGILAERAHRQGTAFHLGPGVAG
jgi:hypothetical protein